MDSHADGRGAAARIDERSRGFSPDMRISLRPVFIIVLIIGLMFLEAGELPIPPSVQNSAPPFSLLIAATLAIAWQLEQWQLPLARWLIVLLFAIVVFLVNLWLPQAGVLVLMPLVVALAAMLINVRAAAATAVGTSLLLILSPSQLGIVDPGTGATSIIGVWAALAIMCAIYHPIYHVLQWAWDLCQHAQSIMDETRDRKVELLRTLESLAHANRTLALANERVSALRILAEDAERAKAEFVARVSHEFRTPLNIIIGMVDLMVENPETYAEELPPDLRDDLQVVQRNCKHLASMINDVLDLSQAEAGRQVIYRERQDLAEIVNSALAIVRPLIEKKRLALEVTVPENLQSVYCDRTRIHQVVLNLVSNAARYTDAGSIKVLVQEQEDRVVVAVSDTGPGVTPEEAKEIFRPFFRGASALLQDRMGSGLGLTISKRFVEQHGGQMRLDSKPGVGSVFSFSLPFTPPAQPVPRPDQWIREDWIWSERVFPPTQTATNLQLSKPRVVVCDETGSLYHEFVRSSDAIEFVWMQNPLQAVQELKRCPAHALVINTATTGDLWSWLEAFKHQVPDTPIVVCSVPRPDSWAVETGALGQLTKPVSRAQLQEAIESVGKQIRRVLLVDDDQDVLALWTRSLHVMDNGLDVVTASGGQQALSVMRSTNPDLVLLDMMMPDMNGQQVLLAMRSDELLKDIPVFFVSALDPGSQPLASSFALVTAAWGLPISKLLRCSLSFSAILLKSDGELDRWLG